jgi:hypothetical protein
MVRPQRKSKKKKKPKLQIMSEKILTAIKGKKEAFHLWKRNGRPKNSDNTYTINKKNTTIELRKQCRLEIAEKRMQGSFGFFFVFDFFFGITSCVAFKNI